MVDRYLLFCRVCSILRSLSALGVPYFRKISEFQLQNVVTRRSHSSDSSGTRAVIQPKRPWTIASPKTQAARKSPLGELARASVFHPVNPLLSTVTSHVEVVKLGSELGTTAGVVDVEVDVDVEVEVDVDVDVDVEVEVDDCSVGQKFRICLSKSMHPNGNIC
jgi:hypothetical protein